MNDSLLVEKLRNECLKRGASGELLIFFSFELNKNNSKLNGRNQKYWSFMETA
jgi:hypothetical protein